jgi:hypothetical protein
MDFRDSRTRLALLGAVVALAAGLIFAGVMTLGHRGDPVAAPPASRGGLVIDPSAPANNHLANAKPLRCFVAGQYVGDLTLADCAQKNGVATDALDVGLDPSGALAAAQQGGAVVTPLPPADAAPTTPAPAAKPAAVATAAPAPAGLPAGACWRYADAQWRKLPSDMTLNACVQTLFAGHCEHPGAATYGRWMQQTLRLVPGKVEVSGDNRSFHTLVEQGGACSLPPVG